MIRRFIALLLLPMLVISIGTTGYVVIEGWSLFDALYMTTMTVTTVGYREVNELSRGGQAFTIVLMLGGIYTLFFAIGEVIRSVVTGEIQAALGRQRMERSLAGMKNHMIVCGFGRMGRLVCKEFATEHIPFVVIDKSPNLLEDFHLEHGLAIHGDATLDDTLRQAGIDRARALVTLVASDAANLYITMSARLLCDKIFIVARAEDERDEQKLIRAGANRVVSPYMIGGARVAQAVLRPTVVDFIELATKTEHLEIQIEEIQITPGGRLVNVVLKDSQVRQQFGVIIVAIKKASGKMTFNPPGEAVMEAGDILIVLGNRQQLDELEKLAKR